MDLLVDAMRSEWARAAIACLLFVALLVGLPAAIDLDERDLDEVDVIDLAERRPRGAA